MKVSESSVANGSISRPHGSSIGRSHGSSGTFGGDTSVWLVVGWLVVSWAFACGDDASATDASTTDASTADASMLDSGSEHDAAQPDCLVYGAAYSQQVAYDGQVFRHAVIRELSDWIGNLSATIDADAAGNFDSDEELIASFDFYYDFDGASSEGESLRLMTDPPLLQETWTQFPTLSNLKGKMAGNDDVTDHRDWDSDGMPMGVPMGFAGWGDATALDNAPIDSPEMLLRAFFAKLAANGVARATGLQPRPNEALLPAGEELPVYVTAEGLDLKQLIQKFLLMAIPFQQATDDYLSDDVDGKGLRASNVVEDGESYSALMHAWDEGFGYFGAARDYACYVDDEIAGAGGRVDWQTYHDSNEDGRIDLATEFNSGASVNAAKRDRGASEATDLTSDAFSAFITGRDLIAGIEGELSESQLIELRGHRDAAVRAFEGAIAATVVHYINEVVADIDALGTDGFDFLDYAKHWSEMKGFALGLQFNPASPLHADHPTEDGSEFAALQRHLGSAPVLPDEMMSNNSELSANRSALLEARELMQRAYGFSMLNVESW